MTVSVSRTEIPRGSEIAKATRGAYYFDTYQAPILADERSALDLYLDMVNSTPEWVNWLMTLRNKVASVVGLKNLGHLGGLEKSKLGSDYHVGDRVGIFSVLFLSDREVILADSDKHLDVKLSVYKMDENKPNSVSISTVVHVHNALGRSYMLFVIPLHKLIAPAMLKKIEAKNDDV